MSLLIEGKGPCDIARIFAEGNIERPTYYQHTRGIVNYENSHDLTTPYAWSGNSIARMITKLQSELDSFTADTDRTERFINIVNKYTLLPS